MKGACADVHQTKFFKVYSPTARNTSKPKPITKSKDRMCIVDSGTSLHTTGKSFFTIRHSKNYLEIKPVSGVVRSTQVARVFFRELGTKFVREVGDYSWQPGGNRTSAIDKFVPLVLVTGQKVPDSARGNLCQIQKSRKTCKNMLEPFPERLIDDAVLVRKTRLVKNELAETLLWEHDLFLF